MKMVSKVLMAGSLAAVILAGLGYMGYDFWLASTQWLLVASVLALFGVYLKVSE
ncbi:MAG: hypothetical protein US53_C0008G0001 [Candidatus Woesebacteria bacterium GW2011_GWA1_37_7]|uniref:Uncharacterized protein n=1 Tax=Candidatus Woesebacteria bacterium GW2011_GWA1_37_7 TaxID=1618545 RepID=A0A0G0HH00_9BACT|nr:MAG: hypothetical protein US53_C0008G0001 [Candidatus Woesebacteria bacterium GW2011_GWA1_37_7]